jgi:hypothetical protein
MLAAQHYELLTQQQVFGLELRSACERNEAEPQQTNQSRHHQRFSITAFTAR